MHILEMKAVSEVERATESVGLVSGQGRSSDFREREALSLWRNWWVSWLLMASEKQTET